MTDKITTYGDPLTLPAVAPLPDPDLGQEKIHGLVEGAIAVANVAPHDEAPVEAKPKPSFYDELTARLKAGEEPSEALLDEALKHKSVRSVGLLAHLGINLDKLDEVGNTRLHLACKEGNVKVVKILLFHGADTCPNPNVGPAYLPAFDLPPKLQHQVLRQFAVTPKDAMNVYSWAILEERGDIAAWLMSENLLQPDNKDLLSMPKRFLEGLDGCFERALFREKPEKIANCLRVLRHLLAWCGPSEANELRVLLKKWHDGAKGYEDTVKQFYDLGQQEIQGKNKLVPLEEEISRIKDTTVERRDPFPTTFDRSPIGRITSVDYRK